MSELRLPSQPCGHRPTAPSSLPRRYPLFPPGHFCIFGLQQQPFLHMPSRKTGIGPSVSPAPQLCAPVTCLPLPKKPKAKTDSCLVLFPCLHCRSPARSLPPLMHAEKWKSTEAKAAPSVGWELGFLVSPHPRSQEPVSYSFFSLISRHLLSPSLVSGTVWGGVAIGYNGGPSPEQETARRQASQSLRRSPTLSILGSKSQVFFLFLKKMFILK